MVTYQVDKNNCNTERQAEALATGKNLEKYKIELVLCSDCYEALLRNQP